MGVFESTWHGASLPFSLASLAESCLFWHSFERSLHPAQDKLADEVVTDDVTCGKRDVDPHGRLRAAQWRMG